MDSIGNLVSDVTKGVDIYEKSKNYKQGYSWAQQFLSSYRHCSWKGRVSGELLQYLQECLVSHMITRKAQKVMPLYLMGIAGFIGAALAWKTGEMPYAAAIGAVSAVPWIAAVVKTQMTANYAKLIQDGLDKPDVVESALARLYQMRSKHG